MTSQILNTENQNNKSHTPVDIIFPVTYYTPHRQCEINKCLPLRTLLIYAFAQLNALFCVERELGFPQMKTQWEKL